ncbi:rRNA maturation RNase YbeY [Candidatus Nomurabacteria bacterium]|nr:rRNA maturation RNase YbeY [Candidatus Nomurabacteria bacterium]
MNKQEKIIFLNKRSYSADFSWLPALEKIIVKRFKLKKNISIALVSEKEIRELNRVYRRKDKVTDVLSFNLDSEENLGEVIICLEQSKRQATTNKKTIKSELKLLTVHGILHLLGYDHELNEKEYLRQEKEQTIILELLEKHAT